LIFFIRISLFICKDTNKSRAIANLFAFAERKYLRRSQRYDNTTTLTNGDGATFFRELLKGKTVGHSHAIAGRFVFDNF
ncbi:MAG: hypothetical protein J6B44_07930, partial [Muribaculaceae bacterium]|nr:hypothetical protein [Muribaculaceae bacterium]